MWLLASLMFWPCYQFIFLIISAGKEHEQCFLCYFFHATGFSRPAEASMNLEVLIHSNCLSWWYGVSIWSVRNWTSKTVTHQLTTGVGCFCQVLVPCSYLGFVCLFVLTVLGCTVELVWQCITALCPGQNKEQSIMESWSCRGSFKWQTVPWNNRARGMGCLYFSSWGRQ